MSNQFYENGPHAMDPRHVMTFQQCTLCDLQLTVETDKGELHCLNGRCALNVPEPNATLRRIINLSAAQELTAYLEEPRLLAAKTRENDGARMPRRCMRDERSTHQSAGCIEAFTGAVANTIPDTVPGPYAGATPSSDTDDVEVVRACVAVENQSPPKPVDTTQRGATDAALQYQATKPSAGLAPVETRSPVPKRSSEPWSPAAFGAFLANRSSVPSDKIRGGKSKRRITGVAGSEYTMEDKRHTFSGNWGPRTLKEQTRPQ